MARMLSETLMAPLVPEISRDYLNQKISKDSKFNYSEPDLLEIAHQQHQTEQNALNKQPELLICDTDLLVLIIWSEVRFGHCHGWIQDVFEASLNNANRHYFLCDYQVPWEPDPLRESADSRAELYDLYQQKLEFYGITFNVIAGNVQERLTLAQNLVGKWREVH